jgi:hypothetical protein
MFLSEYVEYYMASSLKTILFVLFATICSAQTRVRPSQIRNAAQLNIWPANMNGGTQIHPVSQVNTDTVVALFHSTYQDAGEVCIVQAVTTTDLGRATVNYALADHGPALGIDHGTVGQFVIGDFCDFKVFLLSYCFSPAAILTLRQDLAWDQWLRERGL